MSEPTPRSHRRGVDLWAGLCVAAVGIVGLVAAYDIFVPRGLNASLGPRAFPLTISLLLIALGAMLALRSVRTPGPPIDAGSLPTLAVMSLAMAGYLVLFGVLGFMLATVVFLTGMFVYLGERRVWLAAVAGVVISAATTLTFTEALNVNLPPGPLGL